MNCLEPVPYTKLDQHKCNFLRSKKFYLILVVWIIGMLLISSLGVSLMILSVSSFASKIPKLNKTQSTLNSFSKGIPMISAQPDVRPLKPSNHKLMNMPQVSTPSRQHETLRLVERLEVQPNYYNPRNTKGKLLLPLWHLAHLSDNKFERLPTDGSSFSNQIPRPPRLARTLSENRRRYIETASEQPRPFNFPLEGPQPSEFKKTKSTKKESTGVPNKAKKVNNIQDILRQEQVLTTNQYRMPVGIHISGSFKNLQNSGISNVFRKYVQMQPQMSPSQYNYQRIAFDPFYPYKPKSLNEINSLAMKQLGLNRSKKKNKNNVVPSLIFQQSGHSPVSADYYLDALRVNNSLNGLGGQRNLKNEPFSLKLEVFPIRSGKKVPMLPITGAQFVTTIRPNTQNFEPFYPQIGVPYGIPIDNGASYLNYVNNAQQYKGRLPHSQSLYSSTYQRDKHASDAGGLGTHTEEITKSSEKKPKANSNQLMVHLNVFPSKKENVVPQNHLYDVIHADVHERTSSDVPSGKNGSPKSTYIDCETGEKFLDDEGELYPYESHSLTEDTLRTSENSSVREVDRQLTLKPKETLSSGRNDSVNAGNRLSTFRFPVENVMQFQANDAVI